MVETGFYPPFSLLGDRVFQIFMRAQEEAKALGHPLLRREDLFLGIIKQKESPAKDMLRILEVDLRALKTDIEALSSSSALNPLSICVVDYDVVTVLQNSVSYPRNPVSGKVEPRIGSEKFLICLSGINTGPLSEVLRRHNINPDTTSDAFEAWREIHQSLLLS